MRQDEITGGYHIVHSTEQQFANYVEEAVADVVLSENPNSLNRIPKSYAMQIGAATENACHGLNIDCGNYYNATIMLWSAGVTATAGIRYSASINSSNLPSTLRIDALGDPDYPGSGFRSPSQNAWSRGNSLTIEEAINYHFNQHPGPWRNGEEYTKYAQEFYSSNVDLAKPHLLRTGEMGIKISTNEYYGIYTTEGKIVSFGVR